MRLDHNGDTRSSRPELLIASVMAQVDTEREKNLDTRENDVSTRTRRAALALVIVGLAGSAVYGSTLASFSATTSNTASTLAAGTLVLSNKTPTGSACLSTGAGTVTDTNVNAACDAVVTVATVKPGDSSTGNLTLKNEGTIAASALKLFTAGCTNADTVDAYHGTGLPCGKVQVYVQRWSDAAFTTPAACVYGGATTTNVCDFSDTTKTLTAFATSHGSTTALNVGAVPAATSVYVTVGVKLPLDADNTFQGRKASLGLTWSIEQ